MKEEWLIDGYNLLHDLQSRSSHKGITRHSLCGLLAEFASSKQCQVMMFLDGVGPAEELSTLQTDFFQVIYSQKVSADAAIERRLFERRGQAVLAVVTNDRAITEIARGGGAKVLNGKIFEQLLKETSGDRSGSLLKEQIRSHGFNRPFDEKLRKKGIQ